MPTPASAVGSLALPLPAGVADSAIDDPTVHGLALYFQHWLRYDLNAKLASRPATASDVCPHLFFWSSLDPAPTFVRGDGNGTLAFPALYLWGGDGRVVQQTTVRDAEEREIVALWIFQELAIPGAMPDHYGLRNAVAKSLERAISLRAHPTFSLNGGSMGQPIATAVGLSGRGIMVKSVKPGMLSPIPKGVGTDQQADQPNLHAFPSVEMRLTVWERIEQMQPVPGDVARAVRVGIGTMGLDPNDPLPTDERYLQAPP